MGVHKGGYVDFNGVSGFFYADCLLILVNFFRPSSGVDVPVVAMQILQNQWGSEIVWTGKDPCANNWVGVACSNNRVITL